MDESNILDWNPLSALGLFPEAGEEICWAGQPSLTPLIPGFNMEFLDRFWLAYYAGIFICIKNSLALHILRPAALAGCWVLDL